MSAQNAHQHDQQRSFKLFWVPLSISYIISNVAFSDAVTAATLNAEQQAAFNAAAASMSAIERQLVLNQIAIMSNTQVESYFRSYQQKNPSSSNVTSGEQSTPVSGATVTTDPSRNSPVVTTQSQESALPAVDSRATTNQVPSSGSLTTTQTSMGSSSVVRTTPYEVTGLARSLRQIEPFLSRLSSANLRTVVTGYSTATPVRAYLDYRSIRVIVSSPSGSSAMRLQIPEAGIDRTFATRSRDLSLLSIGKYVTDSDERVLQDVMKAVVAHATDDPVAGNPSSLLGRMLSMDFRAGSSSFSPMGEMAQAKLGDWGSASLLGWHQFGGTSSVNTLAVPITLGHRLTERWELYADTVPTVQQINGRPAYSSMLAAGANYLIHSDENIRWTIGGSARGGIAGSPQTETVGGLWGVAATTEVRHQLQPDLVISGASTIAHYSSLPITYGSYDLRYETENTGFRNGIALTKAMQPVLGMSASITGNVVDSRFSGTALAVNSWQEYGAMLTLGQELPARIGVSYMRGERNVQGVSLRASVNF